jgi:hypothetical protein
MKHKTALLAILVAMAVFGLLQARGGLFGVDKKDVRSAAFLSEVAAELNKQLPKPVDPETELSSVTGLEGVFVYNYRIVSRSAAEVDANAFVKTIKPPVTTAACTAPQTHDRFLKQGVTLRYAYADRNGTPITSFDVTPSDCDT